MMKRIYLFTFLLLCAAPAYAVAPFGLLGGVGGPQPFPYIHLLNKIVREHKVCVEVVDLLDEADTQPYFEMLEKGYNKWFSHTAKAIERSGRQEEFADLMPVLKCRKQG